MRYFLIKSESYKQEFHVKTCHSLHELVRFLIFGCAFDVPNIQITVTVSISLMFHLFVPNSFLKVFWQHNMPHGPERVRNWNEIVSDHFYPLNLRPMCISFLAEELKFVETLTSRDIHSKLSTCRFWFEHLASDVLRFITVDVSWTDSNPNKNPLGTVRIMMS